MSEPLSLRVNGVSHTFVIGNGDGEIPASETLRETLRQRLDLTSAKQNCDRGVCGCCTVIMDGDAVASCMVLTADCDGRVITTFEGLRDPATGARDPLFQAFMDVDFLGNHSGFVSMQGIVMSCKALLDRTPFPSDKEVVQMLASDYECSISHSKVIEAVRNYIESREGTEG